LFVAYLNDINEVIELISRMGEEELKLVQKAVNEKKKSFRVIRKNGAYSQWDLEVAKRMEAMIRKEFTQLKPKSESQLQKWAVDIRKLRKNDGYDKQIIINTIKFALKDPFWKKNILSAAKLRNKFDVLLVASTKEAPKPVVDLSHRDKISRRPVTKRVNEPDGEGYKKFQEAKKKLIDRKSI